MVLRSKPEKVEERERTRLALLQATLSLAAQHGFAGLGLREVSRGAQIAPTSFYRHFADMAELSVALVDELVAPLLASWLTGMQSALARGEPAAQALVAQTLLAARDERDLLRFVLAERVGAMQSCRLALRRKLDELAQKLALSLSREDVTVTAELAEAALTLLLDGLGQTFDLDNRDDEPKQQEVMKKVERQLTSLLGGPDGKPKGTR
jgi:AcrR family transcriptional regulator